MFSSQRDIVIDWSLLSNNEKKDHVFSNNKLDLS